MATVNQEFLLTDYFLRISPMFHILDLLLLTLFIFVITYLPFDIMSHSAFILFDLLSFLHYLPFDVMSYSALLLSTFRPLVIIMNHWFVRTMAGLWGQLHTC
jgi:hypothetical protein